MSKTPRTRQVGDWVRVQRLRYVSKFELPQWAMINNVDGRTTNVTYMAQFNEGPFWFNDSDITPDADITDAQWAELAQLRLVRGV